MATRPAANPSNPSVRLTALEVAVIINTTNGIYKILKSNTPLERLYVIPLCAKNGIEITVLKTSFSGY